MLSLKVIKKLKKIVGKEYISVHQEDLLSYSYDATQVTSLPEAVVFPGSTQEISAIMKLANQYQFPVLPRGAGSGMSGGAVPIKGGVVLTMSRLNRILEIDERNMYVWVEPGVVTGDLQEAVAKKGLFYPPDPASLAFSTIGGNVAECAGGARAVKYGVTKDYVMALEVVLPTGKIIHTGHKTIKGVTGYNLTPLFIGSEGTLGIFTKILLRLLPLPPAKATLLLGLPQLELLPHLLNKFLRFPEPLTAIEFIDDLCIQCVENHFQLGLPAVEGLLLLEVDGSEKVVEIIVQQVLDMVKTSGVKVIELAWAEKAKKLWEVRRAISPAVFQLGSKKSSHDIVVPRAQILNMVKKIQALRQDYGLPVLCFGHIGDGNLHVNIMYDETEEVKAQTVTEKVIKAALILGGTISGEHGIGLTKARFLSWEINQPTLKLMQQLKQALDPNNILNPGKIFLE
ncbi:MAG: FAD-binding protein [Candidatus Desulfofervidaceae bacterium]|nr:FAD-binding protein [Candidatus Desulfofervidaceae bacterium]